MSLRRLIRQRRASAFKILSSFFLLLSTADSRLVQPSFENSLQIPIGTRRPTTSASSLVSGNLLAPLISLRRRRYFHSAASPLTTDRFPPGAPSPAQGHFLVTQKISTSSQSQIHSTAPGPSTSDPAHPLHTGYSDSTTAEPSVSGVLGPSAQRSSGDSSIPSTGSPRSSAQAPAQVEPHQNQLQGQSRLPKAYQPASPDMSFEWQVGTPRNVTSAQAPVPSLVLPPAAAPVANETYVIEVDATKEEVFASQSILLQIFMLGVAFVVGHVLRRRKFYYIHEASAALLIGLAAGTIGNFYYPQEGFRDWLVFKEDIFMLFLLPPIIFESGFSLQVKPFFDNFGAILVFSLLGTFIAAMVTGVLVYIGGFLFLMYQLSFLESLVFGALISATDPVTVLAIFQELGADTNLYALVFGESVLNDAMAITMYRTLMSIVANPDATHSLASAVRYAGVTLVGSMSIGMGVALVCALLFKYAGLAVHNLHNLECCLIVLFPYLSYLVAEGLAMSGIVAILFCGVVMKRYTFPNLSEMAQTLSAGFFQLIASLAETFTFIYMGSEIALGEEQSWGHVNFIFFSIVIIGVARAANVFPCAHLVNLFRPPSKQIPESHQKALWWSGLRGAMAFALALQAVHDLPNESHAKAIFTTTIAIVMVTVLGLGGSTATILEKLEVSGDKFKRSTDDDSLQGHFSSSFGRNGDDDERQRLNAPSKDESSLGVELDLAIPETLREHLGHLRESTSFENLDSKYIRPFFTGSSDTHRSANTSPNRPYPNRPVRTNSKNRLVNSH